MPEPEGANTDLAASEGRELESSEAEEKKKGADLNANQDGGDPCSSNETPEQEKIQLAEQTEPTQKPEGAQPVKKERDITGPR